MDKMYQCECGQTFDKYQQMSAHKAGCKVYLESVGKESEFICDICGEHFGNKGALNAHKRKHDGTIVPYKRVRVQCEICGQLFAKTGIKQHLKRHRNNPKSFEIKETYKLDHNDPFCKFCGKRCKNKNSLAQHEIRCKQNPQRILVINKDERVFNCIFCNRQFVGYASVRLHEISCKLNPDYETLVSERVDKFLKTFRENEAAGKHKKIEYHHTEETKRSIGNIMSKILSEGYDSGRLKPNHGIGRGKGSYIIVNNVKYFCRSRYEFIYALHLYYLQQKEFEIETLQVPAIRKNKYGNFFRSDFYIKKENLVIEIKGIKSDKDELIRESFEKQGYKFIEIFEQDIKKCQQELIEFGIDMKSLLKEIKIRANEKNYLVYSLDQQ